MIFTLPPTKLWYPHTTNCVVDLLQTPLNHVAIVEGIRASGKTTLQNAIAQRMAEKNIEVEWVDNCTDLKTDTTVVPKVALISNDQSSEKIHQLLRDLHLLSYTLIVVPCQRYRIEDDAILTDGWEKHLYTLDKPLCSF